MKPLGIDLGKLGDFPDWRQTPFIPPTCPGAKLRVTRSDLAELVRGGEHFDRDGTKVPNDGAYGDARVRCGNALQGFKGAAGYILYPGICPSCTRLESENRATLRERQGTK